MDADTNKDLDGAIDCSPINKCVGSTTKFNIRADVFGDVDKLYFTVDGPVSETRTESTVPYAVFSDNGEGSYNGKELPPGNYTMMATARNADREFSAPYVKVFRVSPQDVFGVSELVFVDVETDEDIEGALEECDPVNECFGSATLVPHHAVTN